MCCQNGSSQQVVTFSILFLMQRKLYRLGLLLLQDYIKKDLLKIAKALGRLFKDIHEIEQDIMEAQEYIGVPVRSHHSSIYQEIILRLDELYDPIFPHLGAGD